LQSIDTGDKAIHVDSHLIHLIEKFTHFQRQRQITRLFLKIFRRVIKTWRL
jgi:hypothetical protein